jgi:hypothetical protein
LGYYQWGLPKVVEGYFLGLTSNMMYRSLISIYFIFL